MKYCITMERTMRVALSFEAANDDDAIEKANRICQSADPSEFEDGVEERDFALVDGETHDLIIDWS